MSEIYHEFMMHFPKTNSRELIDYARDVAFVESRYLFVWRVKTVQMAFCTHCHEEYPLGNGQAAFKHNEKTTCLNCSSTCVVKNNGRGRKHLQDYAYIVWYEKSVIDPNVIVARALHATRDYSGDYRNVETTFVLCSAYIFEIGRGGRQMRREYPGTWREMRSVSSYVRSRVRSYSFFAPAIDGFVSYESIERAISGTPLQYSMWQEYEDVSFDYLDFFHLAAKYPCVEYLTKMGLKKVIETKLRGMPTYRVINWRGKTVEKVLRMPRPALKQILKLPGMDVESLRSYQFWTKLGWQISVEDAHALREILSDYHWKKIVECEYEVSPIEVAKYLLRQMRRPDAPQDYDKARNILTEWNDNINISKEIGMDIQRRHIVFPNNLHETHDKNMRKVKIKRDKDINRIIAERVELLQQYALSNDQFVIRPAASTLELFDEGKALEHCVGSYAGRYASGTTELYLVRRATDPDVPFVTVEVSNKTVVQARGYKNGKPSDDVQAFLKKFEKRLKKRASKQTEQSKALAG